VASGGTANNRSSGQLAMSEVLNLGKLGGIWLNAAKQIRQLRHTSIAAYFFHVHRWGMQSELQISSLIGVSHDFLGSATAIQ
jgi:hypothetical protein